MDIRKREYSLEDQLDFATLTGDHNPIHVDPIKAQGLLYGEIVVHGMHQILYALYSLTFHLQTPIKLTELKAKFIKPALLDRLIYLKINNISTNSCAFDVYSQEDDNVKILSNIDINYVQNSKLTLIPNEIIVRESECKEWSITQISNMHGTIDLGFDYKLLEHMYPNILEKLDYAQLAFLFGTTKLVGMECPGLLSLLTRLKIKFAIDSDFANQMQYEVTHFNDQLKYITLQANALQDIAEIECIMP